MCEAALLCHLVTRLQLLPASAHTKYSQEEASWHSAAQVEAVPRLRGNPGGAALAGAGAGRPGALKEAGRGGVMATTAVLAVTALSSGSSSAGVSMVEVVRAGQWSGDCPGDSGDCCECSGDGGYWSPQQVVVRRGL